MKQMTVLLPLLVIFGINILVSSQFKKKFGKCLPLTLIIMSLVMYGGGFLENFLFSKILIILLSCVGYCIFVKKVLSDREFLKQYIFTNGFYATVILYIIVTMMNHNVIFTAWDEYSHWGVMVKEMLRNNNFYSTTESALSVHKDYPPIIPLFETLWCNLRFAYKESYCITSLQFLTLSFFIPAIEKSKKSILFSIVASFLVFLSCYNSSLGYQFVTIYTDCILGMTIAYLLYSVYIFDINDHFHLFNLSLSLSFLMLIKQMGIAFYVLTLFYLICKALIKKDVVKKKFVNKKIVIKYFICFMIPLLLSKLWNIYINQFDITKQFDLSEISFSAFISIINGSWHVQWQVDAFHNYIDALFHRNIIHFPLELSYFSLIIIIICFLTGLLIIKKEKILEIVLIDATIIVGAIGYAFSMLLLYVFNFGPAEGPSLASFERYLGTYTYAIALLFVMIFIGYISYKENRNKSICATCIIILLVGVSTNYDYVKMHAPNKEMPVLPFSNDSNIILNNTTEKDKIFILAQGSSGEVPWYIHYQILPREVDLGYFSIGTPNMGGYRQDISEKEFKKIIKKYDYLYVYSIDDYFNENYTDVFVNLDKLEPQKLYKISIVNKQIELEDKLK